jgi:hypothetical protein
MPARDIAHQVVKQALITDGWTITDDPLFLQYETVEVFIDLGAEKLIAAEKSGTYIAVEIKSFVSPSVLSEFHTALGQFLNYQYILQQKDPTRILYLAVPLDVYNSFFRLPFTQAVITQYHLNIIVYHPERQEVQQWINS